MHVTAMYGPDAHGGPVLSAVVYFRQAGSNLRTSRTLAVPMGAYSCSWMPQARAVKSASGDRVFHVQRIEAAHDENAAWTCRICKCDYNPPDFERCIGNAGKCGAPRQKQRAKRATRGKRK